MVKDPMAHRSALETPAFLVAMPQVADPFFHRSVVLLLHHDDNGSFGFILNRATELSIRDILSDLEITWRGGEEVRAYFGGPVEPELGWVLLDREDDEASSGVAITEVGEGLAMTQHLDDLSQLAGAPPSRMRLFLGYAGWGEEQLLQEILRNDWLLAPVDRDLIFASPVDEIWERAVRSAGIDPSTLPSWTAPDTSGEEAN